MLILSDNDVVGAVNAIRHILQTREWNDFAASLDIRFTDFEALGLRRNASDRTVCQTRQSAGALLITANRAGDEDSLDAAIRDDTNPASLPLITLADPQRIVHDRSYAETAALRLLDYVERVDSLRGTGRLFVP